MKDVLKHKEVFLFLVLFIVLIITLVLNNFGSPSITGRAVTDVNNLSPNYVLAILIFLSAYALIVSFFARTRK